MNEAVKLLITVALASAAALLASALMLKFTPNDSWAAFVGWTIFFLAIQSPMFLAAQTSRGSCTAWLTRHRNKG